MRTVRKALGWVATILMFIVVGIFLVVEELLPQLLSDYIHIHIRDVPDWIAWPVGVVWLVCVATALWYAALNPKRRRRWRQLRADARERRRKLANFEIE